MACVSALALIIFVFGVYYEVSYSLYLSIIALALFILNTHFLWSLFSSFGAMFFLFHNVRILL